MLDLLNLTLDEKVLGILFLITPFLLIIFKKGIPNYTLEVLMIIIIFTRIITPLVEPTSKIIFAGIGVGCFMFFLPSYLYQKNKYINTDANSYTLSSKLGVAFAFALILSIFFRTLNSTVDISSYGPFQIIGWGMGALALFLIYGRFKFNVDREKIEITEKTNNNKEVSKDSLGFKEALFLSIGLVGVFILAYFAFSSPAVIARWTGASYIVITSILVIMISISIALIINEKKIISKINRNYLWIWNLLFTVSLVLAILVHTISFPQTPSSDPVVVNHPMPIIYQIPLIIMLLLSPIVFIDFTLLSHELIEKNPSPRKLGISFGIAGIFFIILILILIFTNVWGYVEPISNLFRNLFWLPFLVIGLMIIGGVLFINKRRDIKTFIKTKIEYSNTIVLLFVIALATILIVYIPESQIQTNLESFGWGNNDFHYETSSDFDSLKVMTYNIQQGVNETGDKNYDKQLELIKNVNPDIIGLQESDTARISGGNSDVVRYFAQKLKYYSFYGPKTVMGTYGCAILSRFPIVHAETIYTYSNVDEIGTTYVEIQIQYTEQENTGDGFVIRFKEEPIHIFINHPAGSHEAKLAHIQAVMNRVNQIHFEPVISMGDFNSRPNSVYYNYSVAELKDAWLAANESSILGGTEEFEIERRIDHIFVSPQLKVIKTQYITYPQSDHPALWTELDIKE